MSKDAGERLRKAFATIDDTGDGIVAVADLQKVLRYIGIESDTTCQFGDAIHNGRIAIDSFLSLLGLLHGNESPGDEQPGSLGHKLRGVSVHHLSTAFMSSVRAAGHSCDAKIYEIEPTVIRPKGKDTLCPRDSRMGAAYVDAIYGVNDAGLATFMLSYTWGYTIGDVVDTLAQHCSDASLDRCNTFVWICCLCINQHRVKEAQAAGEVIPFERFEAEFGSRVTDIGHIVAMMASWHSPAYVKRVWCNFEMYTATSKGVKLSIIMPPREMEDFRTSLLQKAGIDNVWRACHGVRVEESQASILEDRARILKLIEQGPGYEQFNKIIVERLQAWMVDCTEGYLRLNLDSDLMDTDVKLNLCMTVNKLLRNLSGQQHRAESILQDALHIHKQAQTLESKEGADLLRQIGILRRRNAKYHEASELFTQALHIHEQTNSLASDSGALLLLNRGMLYAEQGELETAISMYQRAEHMAAKANLLRTNVGAMIFRERGSVKESRGDLQGARVDYDEALHVMRETNSLSTPAAAKLFDKLGELMLRNQELDVALTNFAEAKRIRDATNTLETREGASMLRRYGDALKTFGDLEGAKKLYTKSRTLMQDLGLLDTSEQKTVQLETLAQWYKTQYKQGGKFTLPGYLLDLKLNSFFHKQSRIRIWREAIDLSGDSDNFIVLFHYTSYLAFSCITYSGNAASEVRASLVTEGDHANAFYGQGVYATQKSPDMWGVTGQEIKSRILDNNFRRMLQRDIDSMGLEAAMAEYEPRAAYCVPIFVAPELAYNVAKRCTPEMEKSGHGPGKNIFGQLLNVEGQPPRDCWVVRLANGNQEIQAAGAKLVETLRRRWEVATIKYGDDDIDTIHCASRLAYVLRDRSQLKEAESIYRAVLVGYERCLGPKSQDYMTAQGNLALTLKELGHNKEALELYRSSIAGHEEMNGHNDSTTRVVKSNLACCLKAMGSLSEAEPLYKDAYAGDEEEFGQDHRTTLISLNNWAGLLKDMKRFEEAEPLLRRAVEGLSKIHGTTHPTVLVAVSNLAGCLRKLNRLDEARGLYQQALAGHDAALGPEHMSTLTDCSNLAGLLEDEEKLEEAEPLYRRALEGFKTNLGPTHGNTLVVMNNLGLLLTKLEKHLEAEPLYRECLAGLEQMHGPSHPQVTNSAVNLAALLAWNKEFDIENRREALQLYYRCLESFEKRFGPEDEDTKDCKECIEDLKEDIKKEEQGL